MNRSERRQGERLTHDLAAGVRDFAGRDVSQQTFTYTQALDVLSAQALEHAQEARMNTEQLRHADPHGRMVLMGQIQSHLLNSNEALAQALRMMVEARMAQDAMPVRMQVHGDTGRVPMPEQCQVKHELLTVPTCPECGAKIGEPTHAGAGT